MTSHFEAVTIHTENAHLHTHLYSHSVSNYVYVGTCCISLLKGDIVCALQRKLLKRMALQIGK